MANDWKNKIILFYSFYSILFIANNTPIHLTPPIKHQDEAVLLSKPICIREKVDARHQIRREKSALTLSHLKKICCRRLRKLSGNTS